MISLLPPTYLPEPPNSHPDHLRDYMYRTPQIGSAILSGKRLVTLQVNPAGSRQNLGILLSSFFQLDSQHSLCCHPSKY